MGYFGKEWRKFTNADEIMENFRSYKSVTKWDVLNYFGSATTGNADALRNLLNSKYYPKSEVFQHFKNLNNVRYWSDEARDVLKAFYAEVRAELNDSQDINLFLIYRDILEPGKDENRKFEWLDENRDKLVVGDVSWDTFDILANPSLGYDETLKKILTLELFPRDEVKTRFEIYGLNYYNPMVKTYIGNDWWKLFDGSSPALKRLEGDQRFQALEFFSRKPAEEFNSFVNNIKFTSEELYARYKNVRKEGTPKVLYNWIYPIVNEFRKEEAIIRKQNRDEFWLDAGGKKLHEYFRLGFGQNLIQSKEDYIKVLEAYAESGLSVSDFCSRMRIANVEGFHKCLARYQNQNEEFANRVVEKRIEIQKQFVQETAGFVQKIAKGELSVGDYLQQTSRPSSLESLKSLSIKMYGDEKSKGSIAFLKNVIVYYYNRLNSYDNGRTDSENLSKMLSKQEVDFILGKEGTARNGAVGQLYLDDIFRKTTAPVGVVDPRFYKATVVGTEYKKIMKKLVDYRYPFDSKEFFSGTTELMLSDGRIVPVNRETFKKAYQFLSVHNIYKGNGVMRRTMRGVLEGKVESTEEMAKSMRDEQFDHLANLENAKTIEEYLELIEQ